MFDTGFNFALIVLGFGLLIFVHEGGHFLAAKWAGIRTEAFAIGMGTAVVSWRKGIGFAWGSTHRQVVAKTGKASRDLSLAELERHGLGCTEYSLRWLPIGGFVKMLGQDDADPKYVSTEQGSYNVCPIGKRMVVVSAGVAANIVLAIVLFIIAFMIGVQSEKPVVGAVSPVMPAGMTTAVNAEALGISTPGLQPGDLITHIDGKPVTTFVDIRIAGAMARAGRMLSFQVERPGLAEPLEFRMVPEKTSSGLLGIGVDPGSSSRLIADDKDGFLLDYLEEIGLAEVGVRPGMKIIAACGGPIETYEQLRPCIDELDGKPVPTVWTAVDATGEPTGDPINAELAVRLTYQYMWYAEPIPDIDQSVERGLIGLTPLVTIGTVGRGPNRDLLQTGDVILRVGNSDGPRFAQLREELARRRGGEIDMIVLREGQEVHVTADVNRKGQLNITISQAWDLPLIANPMTRLLVTRGESDKPRAVDSPVAGLGLVGRTRLDAVDDTAVTDWDSFNEALRRSTQAAFEAGEQATVALTVTHPTPGREQETVTLELAADEVVALHELQRVAELPLTLFEPLYMTMTADGNPLRAIAMGFKETRKVIVMTYLTLDRLIRGSVGVDQIRGPVGIVHIGAKVADRGVTYLVFFLGIISVNLAVINFLPIPIVDGGLFLFLIYEKLKGRPPPMAFQNATTIAGVAMIATALLVVTWNDLMRLIG